MRTWQAPRLSLILSGHRYYFDAGFPNKALANHQAKKLRARGLLVRIVSRVDSLGHKGYVTYWGRRK